MALDFWALIDQARKDAGGEWPKGAAIGKALEQRLLEYDPDDIIEFEQWFQRMTTMAHQWEICAATYLIWDHVNEDSFSDFKSGLVGLGRETFEKAVADPDSLADHPLVKAIAAGEVERFRFAGEIITFAAVNAYEEKTGSDGPFFEVMDMMPEQPPEDHWSEHFGSPADAVRMPQNLPKLYALFTTGRQDSGATAG